MYRLSHSSPDGFGRVESKGRRAEDEPPSGLAKCTRSSSTSCTILGYFSDNHRKKAGTPILERQVTCAHANQRDEVWRVNTLGTEILVASIMSCVQLPW
mmetsp:Transcript_816/g.1956  ORF Transcript_816/g.1956 Transcript_816/m.1956 type:complete len:99 (+) Transcript_816:4127-4423(+)